MLCCPFQAKELEGYMPASSSGTSSGSHRQSVPSSSGRHHHHHHGHHHRSSSSSSSMTKQQQQAHANKHMNPAMFDQSMRTSSSHRKFILFRFFLLEKIFNICIFRRQVTLVIKVSINGAAAAAEHDRGPAASQPSSHGLQSSTAYDARWILQFPFKQ